MGKAKVYVKFPSTGLGNMLLIWSRAKVFAQLNHLPMVTESWWGIRWGAWYRRERKKRVYWSYFKENSLQEKISIWLYKKVSTTIKEPKVELITEISNHRIIYLFHEISPENDLFGPLRSHRSFIKESINQLIQPSLVEELKSYPIPQISIHVRRGDFKFGNPITPNSFFISLIKLIREIKGSIIPVTVFSDAKKDELEDILTLPNVQLAEDKADILDILLMSMSKVIILSQSSTFSYWAAFLSDAIIIKKEGDWQGNLRPAEINCSIFEGKVDTEDFVSMNKLRAILETQKEILNA